MNPVLRLNNVSIYFPGVKALDEVDFELRPGEVHALLGENGAGKSTLIKVITGAYQRSRGDIFFQDSKIDPKSPGHAQRLGISTVYQEVNLLPNLSVAHNVFLGREPKRWGLINWNKINRDCRTLLSRFNIHIDVTQPLESFSVAIQQLVAIARGVDMSARVLILDEPTASLDTEEVESLFSILRQLKADGVGIIFVTHFLDQVYSLADRITVLRNGRQVGVFETSTLPRTQLIETMLGKELQEISELPHEDAENETAASLFTMNNVTARRSVSEISLDVRHGQTVGLAGLLGSGRTEVCKIAFGIDSYESGEIKLENQPVKLRGAADAIAAGIALSPEDRKAEGIIGPLTIRENIVLALQARRGWWRRVKKDEQQALAQKYITELNVATPNAEKLIEQLSGGNQQKVILGRWLATQPRLLILDEPTRGIDIGAHAEIIKLIRKLCREGMALLVTSSELEELVAFSNKVIVLRDRKKVAELSGADISESNIMAAIAQA